MDLGDGSDDEGSEDDEDDDEDGDDEDDIIEAALARGGNTAKLARLAKDIGRKVKLAQGEDSDEDEEEDEEEEAGPSKAGKKKKGGDDEDGGALWGANKKAYYADESEEYEDDEEALREQQEEVERLEKARASKLKAADYELSEDEEEGEEEDDEDEESEEEEEEEDTMEAAAKKAGGKHKGGAGAGGVEVETVAKDLGALDSAALAEALAADAPELAALVDDLRGAVEEVRHRLGPLLQEVRGGRLATSGGLSYLEAKHLLLLQYAAHITMYLLLKAEGRPVRDHPVIQRLVEIRAYLEKIRPIDKHMSYQIDKLLRAARTAAASEAKRGGKAGAAEEGQEEEAGAADETAYGPRPDRLVPRGGAASTRGGDAAAPGRTGVLAGKGDGVYRPPKLNPVAMEEEGGKAARDEKRRLAEAARRASRSDEMAALAAEIAGAPEELRASLPGFDSMGALKTRQKLEARQAEEEDIMTRVPLSREQIKALKAQRRAGFSAASVLGGDFGDEVAGLVGAAQAAEEGGPPARRGDGGMAELFARQKVSQKYGVDAARPAARGGDEDLPRRPDLGQRRAVHDAVAARRAAAMDMDDDMMGGDGDYGYDAEGGAKGGAKRRRGGEEDDFYASAKASAAGRKAQRVAEHTMPRTTLPPLPDEPAGSRARPISAAIDKNRGLTPHRRKDLKNPRKKHRVKYAAAVVRRKGAVQDVGAAHAKSGGGAAYGGEATGIKSRVAKSRKL